MKKSNVKKISDSHYIINGEDMIYDAKKGIWKLGKDCELSFSTGFKLIRKNK